MRSIFLYGFLCKNRYAVTKLTAGKPMRNINSGFAIHQAVKLTINIALCNRIKRCCRFIKNDNRSIAIKRSADSRLLLLPSR